VKTLYHQCQWRHSERASEATEWRMRTRHPVDITPELFPAMYTRTLTETEIAASVISAHIGLYLITSLLALSSSG
jgi:hypothetical protein